MLLRVRCPAWRASAFIAFSILHDVLWDGEVACNCLGLEFLGWPDATHLPKSTRWGPGLDPPQMTILLCFSTSLIFGSRIEVDEKCNETFQAQSKGVQHRGVQRWTPQPSASDDLYCVFWPTSILGPRPKWTKNAIKPPKPNKGGSGWGVQCLTSPTPTAMWAEESIMGRNKKGYW